MEEILQEIGLSKNEAKIYLKLSEIGLSSAYKVAKESGLFKANTYEALKKLVEKGIVSRKSIDKKVFYEAADPSFLINILDTKKEKLNEIMPSLRLIQKSAKGESVFSTYKGEEASMNVLYHFLEFNEPIYVYGVPKTALEFLKKHRLDRFHRDRIKKKIKMYHIYNFEASERVKTLKKMPYTLIRTLPHLFDSNVSTNICGDEVFFTIFTPPLKTILIKDKDMAEAYKNYFNILWKNAKKV
ncbi:hypothetical protein JW707_04650 [Candidatus Woesearchaeota archaeon]|nr:hypothetical protein [Candidatus Woesearchaeota archaeon]